jgi:Uma2 family endonuclease
MPLNNFAVDSEGRLASFTLRWPESVHLQNEQFFDFCHLNEELKVERSVQGDYEIRMPTGWETGRKNLSLAAQLYIWAEQDGSGLTSDSSTGFVLPNGAIRSPDAAWVKKSRLATLTSEQKQKFLPLCPDFVIELRSPTDNIKTLQAKILEYQENGASLGWLIDPVEKQVFVYQPEKEVISLEQPEFLTADDVLPGFRLDLKKIWDVGF